MYTILKQEDLIERKYTHKKKLMLYESLVKPVLTYIFGTWGLRMKEAHEIDIVHRKQFGIIIEDFKINNRKLHQSIKIYKSKLFGHVLQLPK